jgi:hypothetical protein
MHQAVKLVKLSQFWYRLEQITVEQRTAQQQFSKPVRRLAGQRAYSRSVIRDLR